MRPSPMDVRLPHVTWSTRQSDVPGRGTGFLVRPNHSGVARCCRVDVIPEDRSAVVGASGVGMLLGESRRTGTRERLALCYITVIVCARSGSGSRPERHGGSCTPQEWFSKRPHVSAFVGRPSLLTPVRSRIRRASSRLDLLGGAMPFVAWVLELLTVAVDLGSVSRPTRPQPTSLPATSHQVGGDGIQWAGDLHPRARRAM